MLDEFIVERLLPLQSVKEHEYKVRYTQFIQ